VEVLGHILVVDDDPAILRLVRELLRVEGYEVSVASNAASMRRLLSRERIDLVVLDLLMPGANGLALARELHEHSNVGIIILSGKKETVDRVIGLEIGADDYVVKPFDPRELMARVRSVIRRKQRASGVEPGAKRFRFAGRELDLAKRELVSPEGEPIHLTAMEFDLLAIFVSNPQRVLSREDLLERACHRERMPFDRSVDVEVGRLRRKIETNSKRPELIKTVRQRGYMFAASVERA
jgi:two-component system OmpR family response regulator